MIKNDSMCLGKHSYNSTEANGKIVAFHWLSARQNSFPNGVCIKNSYWSQNDFLEKAVYFYVHCDCVRAKDVSSFDKMSSKKRKKNIKSEILSSENGWS